METITEIAPTTSVENQKKRLIEKLLKSPHAFKWDDLEKLNACTDFDDVRNILKRVYNLSEDLLKEASDASLGAMGKANKKASKNRLNTYKKRIRKGVHKQGKLILAEGDSWFQFPFFITDIIDWLNKNKKTYAINCLAYGGDWITNIIYEAKYISELSIHNPDVFLVSGGGNDLVGGDRLAIMLSKNAENREYRTKKSLIEYNLSGHDAKDILAAQRYIRPTFYAFLHTIQLMYHKMFEQLEQANHLSHMRIITQGYDYPFPRWNAPSLLKPYQSFVNWLVGSGRWLKRPMEIREIPQNLQRPIIKALLFEFNEMFIELTDHHDQVYHIDCRGVASKESDWFDELHLKSKCFKKVAKAYKRVIESADPEKVTRVAGGNP